ncbi:N-formylglutamate amidohydrolase [Sphingobium sp. AN641]|uniref:N-formylglutamate amidohydrolase n=1 Tax=Sphingobium sp. AN641 TaxID=3133443 RepID=UPI0030C1127A
MSEAFTVLRGGDLNLLIVADHASAHVPADINLGVDRTLLTDHVAIDIGVADVAALLVEQMGCSAILGGVSRLVIDLNREEDAPGLLPVMSDGHAIPGNRSADLAQRMIRFHHPYHHQLGRMLAAMPSPFILSLHSFTPMLASDPDQQRPWDIGILYNRDDRAARIAIPMLEQAGLIVGDQLPYSGQLLNATMNRHAEGNGIPYLGVEMQQDRLADAAGQRRYADILGPVVLDCMARLA